MAALDPIAKPAPLFVWPIAALLALAMVGGASFADDDARLEDHFRSELRTASRDAAGAPLIVVLGDSRTVLAFEDPATLGAAVAEQLVQKKGARVLLLAAGGIDIRYYGRLWSDILEAKPALLLIETGLLVPGLDDPATVARKRVAELLKASIGRAQPNRGGMLRAFCLDKTEETARFHRDWLSRRMQEPLMPEAFRQLLDEAPRSHLRVRLLRLPRGPSLQAWIGRTLPQFERETRRRLAKWPWLDPIDAPLLDEESYCDPGHLGPAGRKLMTPWFARTVAQALDAAPP